MAIGRFLFARLRASSYDPGYRDGSVSGMNFAVRSYGKFHPGYRDEKWWRGQSSVTFTEQARQEFFIFIGSTNLKSIISLSLPRKGIILN